jgi:hypothetical protein
MTQNFQAILDWVKEHRPDILDNVQTIIDKSSDVTAASCFLMTVGFEAGRQFQHENPDMEINNPGLYDEGRTE